MRKFLIKSKVALESEKDGWIAVDFDGTLAHYDGWKGIEHLGTPIQPMVDRVKKWLASGKDVRIFTARVTEGPDRNVERVRELIQEWSLTYIGIKLQVTNIKDFSCLEIWDDRAIRVVINTGEPCCDRGE
jgi:hypothetical protein